MKTVVSFRRLLLAFLGSVPLAAHAQNVGVGTLTPGEKLEVVGGNVKISTSGRGLIFPDGTTQTSAASGTGFILNQTGTVQTGGFNLGGTGYLGGRLGIGLTAATQVLDVNGGILARGNSAAGTQGAYLQWNRSGGDGETWLLNQQGGGGGNAGIRFGGVSTTNVATEWARFLNNGNLGIGTTSPGQKLDVNGTVLVRDAYDLLLRDANAGLGWYGSTGGSKVFAAATGFDGPVLYGYSGGMLGTKDGGNRAVLTWKTSGNVGIGTTAPLSRLSISQTTSVFNNTAGQNLGELTFVGSQRTVASASIQALTKNFDDTGHLLFKTSPDFGGAVERLRITADGDVGIGTSAPTQQLDVDGGILARANGPISNQGAYLQWNRSGGLGETWLINQQGGGPGGIFFGKSDLSNNVTEWARFDSNGKLGIGTTNPIAPLHVKGSATNTVATGNASYFCQGCAFTAVSNAGGNKPTTAYFEGGEVWVSGFIVAGNLNTTSDRRIKNVVGRSASAADLALLNKLRITDYTYIDQVNNTPGVVKKVIAQEVEDVLPTAVSRSRQALPNVYERAARVSYTGGFVSVTTAKAHELPASGGRMRFYTPANASLDPEVTVVDAHTVRFASAEAHAGGLFVYGKYVDDFRSVDYDALTTLNVSATQELARKVALLEAQNAALQIRAASAEAKAASAEVKSAQATATTEAFEARLRRLEAGGAQAQK